MTASLNTRSWFSHLDGVSSPERLLDFAQRLRYRALALTDVNNLYGAVDFVEAARERGIRPLLGATLRQKESQTMALIENAAGYRSLCQILTGLNLNETPLADLLKAHAEGLQLLTTDLALAESVREAFAGRLWIELSRPGNASQEREWMEAARKAQLPLVASPAVQFAASEEYSTYRLVRTVGQGGLLDQLPSRLPVGPANHLPSPLAMRQRFADAPEALTNLERLTERLGDDVLPAGYAPSAGRAPKRHDALTYAFEKYGPGHTAMIGSQLRFQPKTAFCEAGRVHGLNARQSLRVVERFGDRIDEMVAEGLEIVAPFGFPLEKSRWPRIVADARDLYGRPRRLAVQPSMVVAPQPIDECVPIERAASGVFVTQFDKRSLAKIGLAKVDLLDRVETFGSSDRTTRFQAAASRKAKVVAPAPTAFPLFDVAGAV